MYDYILPACTRIAKVMKTRVNLNEYLPRMVEIILIGANQEVDFSMIDANDDDVVGEVCHLVSLSRYKLLMCFLV